MIFLLSLTLTLVLCGLMSPLARRFGWVDSPDQRMQHTGNIPWSAIVLAVFTVMLWHGDWSPAIMVLGWSSLIVFITGFVDDRHHIRVPVRFALQILVCGVSPYRTNQLL